LDPSDRLRDGKALIIIHHHLQVLAGRVAGGPNDSSVLFDERVISARASVNSIDSRDPSSRERC